MNNAEQSIITAFGDISSISRTELVAIAEKVDARPPVKRGLSSLLTKGIVAEDSHGVLTLYRKNIAEYERRHPLHEPLPDQEDDYV